MNGMCSWCCSAVNGTLPWLRSHVVGRVCDAVSENLVENAKENANFIDIATKNVKLLITKNQLDRVRHVFQEQSILARLWSYFICKFRPSSQ